MDFIDIFYKINKILRKYNKNVIIAILMRRGIIKKFLYYLGWAIFIGFITYFGSKYRWQLLEKDVAIIFFALFSIVYPIVIGILIKLPNFIFEMKQDKILKWSFDWIKFIAILLPYIFIISALSFPNKIVSSSPELQLMAGVVLGYMLLDSFKKVSLINRAKNTGRGKIN